MKKYINLILLISWMIIIFMMSNAPSVESINQSNFITNIINKILNVKNIELLDFIIRKLAHLFEYSVLGILTINCLKEYRIKNIIVLSIILCFIYACSDEIHQLFVVGRSGKFIDVIIDTSGAIIGVLVYNFIYNVLKKQKFRYCKFISEP